MTVRLIAIVVTALALAGCGGDDSYTFYRNSPLDAAMRIHIASFDSGEGAAYNQENCRVAAELFNAQPGVASRFWCEKGRFQP